MEVDAYLVVDAESFELVEPGGWVGRHFLALLGLAAALTCCEKPAKLTT
ncbi:hypothetical protein OG819_53285 [Streptomyces sp. NBC_01549]|nr:hypothetical protein [Streptomyces sp. NBC_01549]MCX4597986.1 hypothetical protein [Streptomyces sp. NBC_01549]